MRANIFKHWGHMYVCFDSRRCCTCNEKEENLYCSSVEKNRVLLVEHYCTRSMLVTLCWLQQHLDGGMDHDKAKDTDSHPGAVAA
jgi:hypothetical protein